MMRLVIFVISVVISVSMVSSCGQDGDAVKEALSEAESCIEDAPRHSLEILKQIDTASLSSRKIRAKYSLLYSMALDKNYIDVTDFDILQPAIAYYTHHGSSTEQMRTFYYQGRIFQNQDDLPQAMDSFVDALEYGFDSDDILTKARIHFAQSKIWYSLYDWDKFIDCNRKSSIYFKTAGKTNSYANCILRVANGFTLKNDFDSALVYLNNCAMITDSISLGRLGDYHSCYITYLTKVGPKDELVRAIDNYRKDIPESKLDWLSIANAYSAAGMDKEALEALQVVNLSKSDVRDKVKYYVVLSDLLKKEGNFKESLDAYEQYIALSEQQELSAMTQDTKFVEQKHSLEIEALRQKQSKTLFLVLGVCAILILSVIILLVNSRLRVNRLEKERYRTLYDQMIIERDNLKDLLESDKKMDSEVGKVISDRLEILNHIIAATLKNDDDIVYKQIEHLVSDKDSFLKSTALAFEASHPDFINVLKQCGLSDWEIGYCCLYALGLRGKDIANYLEMYSGSYYKFSSNLRKKLGMSPNDTNIDKYLQHLLNS